MVSQVAELGKIYQRVNDHSTRLAKAREFSQDLVIRQEILQEKIRELVDLNLGETEWDELQVEQRQLANANYILQELDFANNLLSGEQSSLTELIISLNGRLNKIGEFIPNYEQIVELINGVEAGIDELDHELQHLANKIEQNPERLAVVDERIGEIYALSRKYRIPPEEITERLAQWQLELANLTASADLDSLAQELQQAKADYLYLANEISLVRAQAAKLLSDKVTALLHKLAIQGKFKVALEKTENFTSYGLDNIQYQICFNQGMALQPLNKVASGGELSRVALALYVTLSVNNPPELIVFDEVDVGISGGVAEVVGSLLNELGKNKQVICITHQPQTACCGDYHLHVSKSVVGGVSAAQMVYITANDRVNEIARMLGGLVITETTLTHAREMLRL